MACNLKKRSLLTLKDYTEEEIECILDTARKLKKARKKGKISKKFFSKTLALVFEKRSTRTRCAFETAFGEDGGTSVFLTPGDIHLGEKESIEDTARVLGRMFNGIMFRGFRQKTAEILVEYSGIPVYNGLTDLYHPTQVLADLMTIQEQFNKLKGIKCVYIGDGRNNVARSLLIGCSIMGVHFTIISPLELFLEKSTLDECKETAKESGSNLLFTDNVESGVKGADVIYTDVWASMGEENKKSEREDLLRPYQVNINCIKKTGKSNTIFLHCLPAEKGKEVTSEVFEGPWSCVWDQAENRKHTIKALLYLTI